VNSVGRGKKGEIGMIALEELKGKEECWGYEKKKRGTQRRLKKMKEKSKKGRKA
jgi:hypothetical protein